MNRIERRKQGDAPAKARSSSFDVARLAGVSRSAVSRTFTVGASVSQKTRAKVIQAAKELGYHPNAIARTLTTRRSNIVSAVVADIENPFYAKAIACMSAALQRRGFTLLLMTAESSQAIDELVPRLLSYQVDGVVVASATLGSIVAEYCLASGLPLVQFNRYTKFDEASVVHCDNFAGGMMAANLLIETGHERIAYIAGIEDTSSNIDRELGLVAGLKRHGRKVSARAVGGYSYDGGFAAAREIVGQARKPDAVFCANDMMALGLIDAAMQEFGLSIPGDLSVIGFDNIPLSGFARYGLTTVDQSVEQMAEQAVELIVATIEGRLDKPIKCKIPCRMVRRSSVRQRG